MSEFVKVCSVDDIAIGETISANIDGVDVAVVHAEDGAFYAIYDECSHASVPLSEGEVEGCTLECWLHGSRFDLRTGRPGSRRRCRCRCIRSSCAMALCSFPCHR